MAGDYNYGWEWDKKQTDTVFDISIRHDDRRVLQHVETIRFRLELRLKKCNRKQIKEKEYRCPKEKETSSS